MVQINTDMTAARYLEFLKRLAVFIPGGVPSFKDQVYVEVQSEFFHESLCRFTANEFNTLLKTLPKTEKTFPPPMVILSALVDLRLSQTALSAWTEAKKVVESYRENRHGHRTCGELTARVINDLGGLDDLSRQDLRFVRKDFNESYERLKIEFIAEVDDEIPGSQPTLVGNRIAVPHGSPDRMCLPPGPSAVVSEQSETEPKPNELVKSVLDGPPPENTESQGRMTYGERLYSIAYEQGWSQTSDVPESFGKRCLNDTEVKALRFCLDHNPFLKGKVLKNPDRGWFCTPPAGHITEVFEPHQDPLKGKLNAGFITEKDHETDVARRIALKDPEKAERFRRRLAEREF